MAGNGPLPTSEILIPHRGPRAWYRPWQPPVQAGLTALKLPGAPRTAKSQSASPKYRFRDANPAGRLGT
jgi:hypothetical protein